MENAPFVHDGYNALSCLPPTLSIEDAYQLHTDAVGELEEMICAYGDYTPAYLIVAVADARIQRDFFRKMRDDYRRKMLEDI